MADHSPAQQQQTAVASSSLLQQLPPASRFVLRGSSQALAAAADALGLPHSETPCRAVDNGVRAALWLGPDERLLIGPAGAAEEMRSQLEQALAGLPHSVVETSNAQLAFELSGPQAIPALNTGCPLDFDPASFPVDMCTRTVFAKAQIVVWRTAPDTFRLEIARSFAPYVTKVLALAARE